MPTAFVAKAVTAWTCMVHGDCVDLLNVAVFRHADGEEHQLVSGFCQARWSLRDCSARVPV